MGFKVNLENDTAETVERGERPDPGYYHARLDDVYDDEKTSGVLVMKWEVLAGNYKGKCLFDRIKDPGLAEDDNKREYAERRIKTLAKRLGLLSEDAYGKEAEIEFNEAVGREAVLRVTSSVNKETRQEFVGIDYFNGVLPLDYAKDKLPKDFPADLRNTIMTGVEASPKPEKGKGAAAGGGGTATATRPAKSKQDLSKML